MDIGRLEAESFEQDLIYEIRHRAIHLRTVGISKIEDDFVAQFGSRFIASELLDRLSAEPVMVFDKDMDAGRSCDRRPQAGAEQEPKMSEIACDRRFAECDRHLPVAV